MKPPYHPLPRMSSRTLGVALLALSPLLGAGAAPQDGAGASAGRVLIVNGSGQRVRLVLNHWVDEGGRDRSQEASWEIEPWTRGSLSLDGSVLVARKIGYRLVTAAGATPEEGKVWVTRHAGGEALELVIAPENLAPRQAARAVLRSAWSFLEDRDCQRLVLRFAHPTAELERLEYDRTQGGGASKAPAPFSVHYRYHWRSPLSGEANTSRLAFDFGADGGLLGVRALGTTSWVPPFAAVELARELIKDHLLQEPDLGRDPVASAAIRELLQQGNTRKLLELVLAFSQPDRADEGAAINRLAWRLVDPDRHHLPGEAARGLRLAEDAAELSPSEAAIADTLAWAFHAAGLHQRALEHSRKALALASAAQKEEYQGYLARLQRCVAAAR